MVESTGLLLDQIVQIGLTYLWFVILAIWGGTANYISRVRKEGMKFSTVELIGEWTVSSFAGIITALLCQEMQISELLTYALVGISGHAGGRAVFVLENMYKIKFGGNNDTKP